MVRTMGINHVPSSQWFTIGQLTYRNNVVSDNHTNNFEKATVTVQPYGSDAEYASVVVGGKLAFNNNCYFNPSGTMWAIYARNGGAYGVLGNTFTTLSSGPASASTAIRPQAIRNWMPTTSPKMAPARARVGRRLEKR